MTTRLCAALTLLTGIIAANAQERKSDERPFDDAEFVKMAASSGMHEVEISKLATTKARNDEVKKFAQKLVEDHTKANEGLKEAAKAANLPVPEKMLADHQKAVDRFKEYKGTNFDADFVKHAVTSHEKSVVLFGRAAKEAKNERIKAFAEKTLPVIKEHLEMAKKIQVRE
jgi:putative membrane protein